MNDLYPVFLRLDFLRCVVIGGGAVAARKVRGLIERGARVRVIAPTVCEELQSMLPDERIEWKCRMAEEEDVTDAHLVFLATSNSEVNASLARIAASHGALVNRADSVDDGSLQVPASFRRGDIAVAISTGGRSPAYAQLLRDEIEKTLSPDRLALLDVIAEARDVIKRTGRSVNGDAWRAAADSDVLALVEHGSRREAVQKLVDALIAPAVPGAAQ